MGESDSGQMDLKTMLAQDDDATFEAFQRKLLDRPWEVTSLDCRTILRKFGTRESVIECWQLLIEDWEKSEYVHFGDAIYLQGPRSVEWRNAFLRSLTQEFAAWKAGLDPISQMGFAKGAPQRTAHSRRRVSLNDAFR